MLLQIDTNFVIEGFNDFVTDSKILNYMFSTVSVLVAFFYAITVVRLYSKKMIGSQIQLSEFLRPFGVLLLIIFWKWIYFNVLVGGFDALLELAVKNRSVINDQHNLNTIRDVMVSDEISLFDLSVEVFISFILKAFAMIINTLLDITVALYVGINDLILGIIGPVVLAFAMLEETKDMFIKWLKYFFFYRVFYFLVVAVGFLSEALLNSITAQVLYYLKKEGKAAAEADVWLAAGLLGILAFVIFKIIFIAASYTILKDLFGVTGTGIGASAGSMVQAGANVKGAFKK